MFFAFTARADEPDTNLWFHVGEELTYDIHWGVFHVGQTHITTSWTNRNGRPHILIQYKTKTNRFVEKVYPVDDTLESLIDAETFLPVYFKKKLSEGRYRCDEVTRFDYKRLRMKWHSLLNGKKKVVPIKPDTRDIITMMYYMRRGPFVEGTTNSYQVMADEKVYDLHVAVQDKESVTTPWGKLKCFKVEPTAAFNGLFVRSGRVIFWVSDDARSLCTRLMAELPVANIRLTLAGVHGPGNDFWKHAKPVSTPAPHPAARGKR